MKVILTLFICGIILARVSAQNDNFANAATLTGTQGELPFDLEGSTVEVGESFSNGSLWYRWTAPGPGQLTLGTTPDSGGTDFRTSAYVGNLISTLTKLGSISSDWNFQDFVQTVDPGQVVMIRIGKDDLTPESNKGTLNYQFSASPANDSRFSPTDLGSAVTVTIEPDNTGASRHPTEWQGNQFSNSGTLWYQWQAPEDGLLYLRARSQSDLFDSVVSLHAGPGSSTDQPIRFFKAGESPGSIRIPVSAGSSHLISYSTDDDTRPGQSALSLLFTLVDPASEHTGAIELPSETPVNVTGTFRSALLDESVSYDETLFEPWSYPPAQSLWYSWLASDDGVYRVMITQGSAQLVIWQDNGADAPTFIAKQDNDRQITFPASTGEKFFISALTPTNRKHRPNSHFRFQLEILAQAENDHFESRLNLGDSKSWEIDTLNFGASSETGEPAHSGTTANQSIWYTWTAPIDGHYLLNTKQPEYPPTLAVYTGASLETLNLVESGSYRLVFEALAGTTYLIAVDGPEQNFGEVHLTLEPATFPENDSFAKRTVLPGTRPVFAEYLRYATTEAEEPDLSNGVNGSVWFEWSPISNNEVFYYSAYSMNIYQSTQENPQLADLVPVQPANIGSERISTTPGDTYYIRLNNRGSSSDGLFIHDSRVDTREEYRIVTPNTNFESRQHLPSVTSLRASESLAGPERQIIQGTSIYNRLAAWWSWTAPETGLYRVSNYLRPSSSTSILVGESIDTLEEIAVGRNEGLFFEARSGTTYHIASFSYSRPGFLFSSSHGFGFDLKKITTPPANDHFSNPQELGDETSFSVLQENFLASSEDGEPAPGGVPANRTVWFKWTAPATAAFRFAASESECRITLYEGDQLNGLTELSSGLTSTTISAQKGVTYTLSVDSINPLSFKLTGSLQFPPFTNNDYEDAVIWTGSEHSAIGSAAVADYEQDEPRPSGASSSNGSNWWKWTAPQTGATTINFEMSRFVFAFYRGNDLALLEPVLAHADSPTLRFHALAGETYSLQLINNDFDEARESLFQLTQDLNAPSNDLFENARALTGLPVSLDVQSPWATQEEGEPQARDSIWYSWQAPSDDLFLMTSTSSAGARVYRGNSLESLTVLSNRGSQTRIDASLGETFYISITPSPLWESSLNITKIEPPINDDFEDRLDLGAVEEASLSIDQSYSTFQEGDPGNLRNNSRVGSIWWQWTAPRDGLLSLAGNIYLFTGNTLDNLEPLNDGDIVQRIQVSAGETYQLASARRDVASEDKVTLQLSMRQIPNDDFANRSIISPELPFSWQGPLLNGTFENFETTSSDGSAWWQWTAPRDGTIVVDSDSDSGRIYRLAPSIVELPSIASWLPTSIQVFKGETYLFQVTGRSFSDSDLDIEWSVPPLSPGEFADPVVIEIPPENQQAPPVFSAGSVYQWIASKSGTLTITSSGEPVRSAILYTGPDLRHMSQVNAQDSRLSDWNRFPIIAGQKYWLWWISTPEGSPGWSPLFGPGDDNFTDASILPIFTNTIWRGDTTGAGAEEKEALLSARSIGRTVWGKWTAPHSGTFCFLVSGSEAGIYQGNQIDGLNLLAEGTGGIFQATQGEIYHITVDSGSREGPFQLTIDPVWSRYERWRQENFGESVSSQSKPGSDPDDDGRPNVIELALGSDPLTFDQTLPLAISAQGNSLTLTLIRPEGVEGVEISFDVSNDLETWRPVSELEHESQTNSTGDGQETYQVILPNHASLRSFVRLRAKISPEN